MNPVKIANLMVIFCIAILAFGASYGVSSVTDGDYLLTMLNITLNETPKLAAVNEGNFTPMWINQVVIIVNDTNETNETNVTTNKTIRNETVINNTVLNRSN